MRIYDVTVPLRDGMPAYPGDEPFQRRTVCRISEGGPCNMSALQMGAHAGTHVDAPWHMTDDGARLDAIPPDTWLGPARVVQVGDPVSIKRSDLETRDWAGVERALFKTANSGKLARLDRFVEDYVYLEGDAAQFLAGVGLRLVGVDYLSVDALHSDGHPGHMPLVRAGIAIIEGLDLSEVPPGDYELFCGPLLIQGGDGAPARVFLRET